MENENEKYYELGGSASIFWDPTQPREDQQTLYRGQVKQLAETERVMHARRAGGLISLSESEAKEKAERYDKNRFEADAKAAKEISAANKTLEAAAVKEEENRVALKEAEIKLEEAKKAQADAEATKSENDKLRARINELEAAAANASAPKK